MGEGCPSSGEGRWGGGWLFFLSSGSAPNGSHSIFSGSRFVADAEKEGPLTLRALSRDCFPAERPSLGRPTDGVQVCLQKLSWALPETLPLQLGPALQGSDFCSAGIHLCPWQEMSLHNMESLVGRQAELPPGRDLCGDRG